MNSAHSESLLEVYSLGLKLRALRAKKGLTVRRTFSMLEIAFA
jgi:hypothetical protein